jgi:diketogulonate reductase-like aldo/keto reductase
MEQKQLGNTNVQIPEIGIGTWEYHAGPEPLVKGIEAGARFIDTAESYGSEEVVGRAIAGRRDEVFVATKVSPWNLRRGDLIKAAEGSLSRLRTDYIDLYQIHRPNRAIPLGETLGAIEELVDAGKVRFVGVSNFSLSQLEQALGTMRRHPIVSNQVRFNLTDRTIIPDLLTYCVERQITVIAYSPLARSFQQILDNDPGGLLPRIARRYARTPVQVALNWCTCHAGVVAIPKGNSVAHVAENCGGSGWRLKPEDVAELNKGISYRRRGRIDEWVRSHLPASVKPAIRRLAHLLPRSLRRQVN